MKGISGKVFTIILGLVVMFVALVLLWYFSGKLVPFISKLVEDVIIGMFRWMCERIPWPGNEFCKFFLGV